MSPLPPPDPDAAPDGPVASRLRTAPFEVVGRFADASNATLLVRLTDRDPRPLEELVAAQGGELSIEDLDADDLAVHKPKGGETPLWDFPDGTLHAREIAAYEVSAVLGWDLVPVTVAAEGPMGAGSLQRFVRHDPAQHYFHLLEQGAPSVIDQLRAMVVFDAAIDNADRKGGHVLLEDAETGVETGVGDGVGEAGLTGRIRLVDHGVSFHVERKLRTVGWHFAGEPVPTALRIDLARLGRELTGGALLERLQDLLLEQEVATLADRVGRLVDLEVFPEPSGRNPFPWPML